MILPTDPPPSRRDIEVRVAPPTPPGEKGWVEVRLTVIEKTPCARSSGEYTLDEARLVAAGVRILAGGAQITWHPNHVDPPVGL